MVKLESTLKLQRCPHCSVDNPNLSTVEKEFITTEDNGSNRRIWRVYKCHRCGGVVTASALEQNRDVREIYPSSYKLDDVLPLKVREYLQQAMDSVFAPAGAIMLCASSVDSMLKEKGLIDGSLYSRITKAAENSIMTKEMSIWAHQVRLDANDQRHSDENAALPTKEEAKRTIEFTQTLAEFLFVLPSKVNRGIENTK